MDSPLLVPLVIGVFFLAGLVKGVIGLGLPTVALSLMTATTDLTTAMALMLVPTFATNLLQAVTGGHLRVVLKRIWLFLFFATVTVWLGTLVLKDADLSLMSALLGLVLILYALMGFSGVTMSTPARRESLFGFLFGSVNGVLTGMVGSYAVPGVIYLQSLGLGRDPFVQAMGLLFLGSTIALAASLSGTGLMTLDLGLMSLWATLPAIAGFFCGQGIRKRLSETLFRRFFYSGVLVLGAFIMVRVYLFG